MRNIILPIDFVRAVAAELPGDWTVDAPANSYAATLTRASDQRKLVAAVATYGSDAGRVTFSDSYAYQELRYDEHPAETTSAPTAKPATVAKRIVARVLEPGEERHVEILERRERHARYVEATQTNADALPNFARDTYGNDSPSEVKGRVMAMRDGYGTVKVHGDSVYLDLNGVSADVAAKILALLAE